MNRNALILDFKAYRCEVDFDRDVQGATSGPCVIIPFPVLAKRRAPARIARVTSGLKPRISRARNLSRVRKSLTA